MDQKTIEEELAATKRELERWKRGQQIEGDYICEDGTISPLLRLKNLDFDVTGTHCEASRVVRALQGASSRIEDLLLVRWSTFSSEDRESIVDQLAWLLKTAAVLVLQLTQEPAIAKSQQEEPARD